MNNNCRDIAVSHFVGLSGVGGVQKNFVEYINAQNILRSSNHFLHKVYTLGDIDQQYTLPIKVYNVRKLKIFFALVLDIISRRKIVHFYNNLTSFKVMLLLFLLPVRKLILHERGTIWNYPSSRGLLLRFTAWKSCLILANSNATKTMLVEKFYISNEKIKVLHNGVNTEIKLIDKKPQRNKLLFFRVGFLGRLETPKGVHVIIDAMRYLSESNIELLIAGSGSLEHTLKKQAKDLNNVSFVGRLENPYTFLMGLDLLIVPSIREPLGNVCLEAGLCKTPVLATNIDGIPEIIENGVTGELLNATDDILIDSPKGSIPLPEYVVNPVTQKISTPKQINPYLLARKILELSKNPALLQCYSEKLHDKVVTYFNMDRYTKELHSVYHEINK